MCVCVRACAFVHACVHASVYAMHKTEHTFSTTLSFCVPKIGAKLWRMSKKGTRIYSQTGPYFWHVTPLLTWQTVVLDVDIRVAGVTNSALHRLGTWQSVRAVCECRRLQTHVSCHRRLAATITQVFNLIFIVRI